MSARKASSIAFAAVLDARVYMRIACGLTLELTGAQARCDRRERTRLCVRVEQPVRPHGASVWMNSEKRNPVERGLASEESHSWTEPSPPSTKKPMQPAKSSPNAHALDGAPSVNSRSGTGAE